MRANSLQIGLIQLPRRSKRLLVILADTMLLSLALAVALVLTSAYQLEGMQNIWVLYPVTLCIAIPILWQQGLYQAVIRFIGTQLAISVLRSVTVTAAAIAGVNFWLGLDLLFEIAAISLIFWSFAVVVMVGSRFAMRAFLLYQPERGERVVVYGAGDAGARLVAALIADSDFLPVAFVDDDLNIQGRSINGLKVHSPDQLPSLIENRGIMRVLLALPSVRRGKRRKIIENLEPLPIHIQTMPEVADLVSGRARVDEIRDVDVADLLGRASVPPDEQLLDACIRGKTVIVTGAGGSIGSQLCRQIIQLCPQRLLLFEISEVALYTLDKELNKAVKHHELDVEIIPLLGSVHHLKRMRSILATFRVDTLYHAAAYKHVPMVEHNMIEGVHNNIFGTWYAAEAAHEAGVGNFVLISTDKAVSPTNVMGATKRFSELVLQAMHERGSDTQFSMVRFGNVLASSGSVVPLFREQIRAGGPVTVTHPEIIRYFMTIPEAAQLVIQAGSMSQGGDVFVLDMGKPVRIEDLARRMIHLMGLTIRDDDNPDGDIAIKYTGLRPAEKLYEELLIGDNVMGTEHPMIMRAMEESLPWSRMQGYLDKLLIAAENLDCLQAREILLESIAGYAPMNGLDDIVWTNTRKETPELVKASVTKLDVHRTGTTSAATP